MNRRWRIDLLVAGMCALFFRCSVGPATGYQGGGGSETINAQVMLVDNSITVDVRSDTVRSFAIGLFSTEYNPFTDSGFFLSRATVDSVIRMAADSLTAGDYHVIIRDSLSGKAVLFRRVTIPSAEPDTLRDTLSPTASLAGTVVPRSSMALNTLVAVIPGTDLWTEVDQAGRFALYGIPAGETVLFISPVVRNKWNVTDAKVALTLDPGSAFDSLVVTINN